MARNNTFAAKGREKGRVGGTRDRAKRYVTIRADQKNTPMEAFIRSNGAVLDDIVNSNPSVLDRGVLRFNSPEVLNHRIQPAWEALHNKGTKGKSLRDYSVEHKTSLTGARNHLIGVYEIHFGQDPKQA